MFPTPKNEEQWAHLRAWFLLRDPKRWTKEWYAKDINGNHKTTTSPDAVCWCLDGAYMRQGIHTTPESLWKIAGQCVTQFNDTHTHSEVLSLICAAYALAQGEQKP
jgi:hypothetical protein